MGETWRRAVRPEPAEPLERRHDMKTWRMMGPGGPMETVAATAAKAWSNLRYRLVHECGMSWYAAGAYDHSDLREVR